MRSQLYRSSFYLTIAILTAAILSATKVWAAPAQSPQPPPVKTVADVERAWKAVQEALDANELSRASAALQEVTASLEDNGLNNADEISDELLRRAHLATERGQIDGGAFLLRSALAISPDSPHVRYLSADLAAKLKTASWWNQVSAALLDGLRPDVVFTHFHFFSSLVLAAATFALLFLLIVALFTD